MAYDNRRSPKGAMNMKHQTLELRNIDEYKVLEKATEREGLCAGDGDYSVWDTRLASQRPDKPPFWTRVIPSSMPDRRIQLTDFEKFYEFYSNVGNPSHSQSEYQGWLDEPANVEETW